MREVLSVILGSFYFFAHAQNWVALDNGIVFGGNKYLYVDQERNELYVHGVFITDGNGDTLRGIAKWDGYKFQPLGKGVFANPICRSLSRYHGKLFASGPWVLSANKSAFLSIYNDINEVWDTIYNAGTTNDWLNIIDDQLILSGFSDSCFGMSTSGICSFNGETWSSLLTLADEGGGFHNIYTIAKYNDQLYVAGNFYLPDYNGDMIDDMAILENNSLYSFGGGFHNGTSGSIQKIVVYKDELYLCGGFHISTGDVGEYIVKWDGLTLSEVGGGTDASIMDMHVYNNYLYVFGYFEYAGGIYSPKVAYWDGESWHPVNGGEDLGPSGVEIERAAFYNDELYVVGSFPILYGDTIYCVAKYNHQLPGDENTLEVFINNPGEEIIVQYENTNEYALSVGIFTVSGQQVGSYLFPGQTGYIHQSIPIPGLASGVYIVTAIAGDKKVSKKLMKI